MVQLRKNDYLQRIIDDFFAKLSKLIQQVKTSDSDKREMLNKCFNLYRDSYQAERSDSVVELIHLLKDYGLIEQYASLLTLEYQVLDIKYRENLLKALSLVEYLECSDTAFSWNRSVLKEDILRFLDEGEQT